MFTTIIKVILFNGYMDIIHVDKWSLRFAINYSKLLIDFFYIEFHIKKLELISKIGNSRVDFSFNIEKSMQEVFKENYFSWVVFIFL